MVRMARDTGGKYTVPQIAVLGPPPAPPAAAEVHHIGGYDELARFDCSGKLDEMLVSFAGGEE